MRRIGEVNFKDCLELIISLDTLIQMSNVYNTKKSSSVADQRNTKNDMIQKLREKIEDLQGEGVKIALSEFPFAVAIVTPIANRSHRHEMSKYIVFVDSTASCDLAGHSITFLLTASPAGALPLGALITSSQGQESYATGFKLLRGLLGCESFGGQGYPGVFMTDDSNAERGGLKEAWPESDQLLCQFHGPQAMWKWLWLGTHKIDNKDRQPLMQLYRNIMYAMDNESATTAYAKAITTADVMGYPQFSHHLHSLWDSTDTVTQQPKRFLWCKAYRKGMTVGNETNNYAESNIRIFKDIILSRLKGYNPIALILLFCGKYEQYYRNRLLDFSNGRKPAAQFRINSLREKAAYLSDANQILRQSEAIFQVPSSNGNGSYDVNISHPSCTCPIGFTGAICKHQYAVSCLFDISPLINVPKVSPKDCRDMATIAVGEENAPNASFYDFDSIESTDENFAPMEISSNVPARTPKAHSVPSSWFIKEKVLEARQLLISNFSSAIDSLALDNPNAHYAVKKLSRVLNKSTPSQVLNIIYGACSKGGYKHDNNGHSIPVNEPATSRRLPGKSRSSKPVKKGRPPTSAVVCGATRSAAGKFPNCLAKRRALKCKRNLGDSIKKNRTNAKKHGESH